jgi:DNA polymerase-3 subunit gamma/tau
MEVPDSVKKKYVDQAQSSPPSLVLTWLNIANQCDINYKASKNQRLSVELALMKMAHVGHVVSADQLRINGSSPEQAALKKKLV